MAVQETSVGPVGFGTLPGATCDDAPFTHTLTVTFGGPHGPDLRMACLLLNTPERILVRRLCRSKHTVKTFAAPEASPLIDIPWTGEWFMMAQASRQMRPVPSGSLTLSAAGATIASRDCYSDELLVGQVAGGIASCMPEIQRGDSIWLRPE